MAAKVSPEVDEMAVEAPEKSKHTVVEADEEVVTDEHADDVVALQRQKYIEIHNLHDRIGCDLRKTPTILHMREAAGEGMIMW